MPRRREVPERPVVADPKYDSKLVTKFINAVMRDGKKSTAESLLYDAFDIMAEKTNDLRSNFLNRPWIMSDQ